MVQWSKAIGTREVLQRRYRLALGGRRQQGGRIQSPRCRPVSPASRRRRCLSLQRISGGTQRSVGAFVQDILTPTSKLVADAQRACRSLENYDGHNLETNVRDRAADARNNRPSHPGQGRHGRQPARGGAVSRDRSPERVGGGRLRVPCADAERAVSSVPRRRRDSRFRMTSWSPERLLGGEAGVNVAPARNVTVRLTWFDNRVKNPVFNVTTRRRPRHAATQNVARDASPRRAGRRRLSDRHLWRFSGGYVYNDAKVTEGGAANADAGRQGAAAGAEASRIAAGRLLEREGRDGRVRRAGRRPAVQRRPERQLHSGGNIGRRRLRCDHPSACPASQSSI